MQRSNTALQLAFSLQNVSAALLASALVFAAQSADASPEDRFESDYDSCADLYFSENSFSCSICGVEAGCDGESCYWGSVKAERTLSEISAKLDTGFQMYCLNGGGSFVASASPIGQQTRGVDDAVRSLSPSRSTQETGGFLEIGANSQSDNSFGLLLPFSRSFSDTGAGDLRVGGNLVLGSAGSVKQFGVAARPTWMWTSRDGPDEGASLIGVGIPGQFLVTTGSEVSTSAGIAGGGSIIAATSSASGAWGGGLVADLSYASSLQVPVTAALRMGLGDNLVVQPAISVNVAAGSAIVDTFQQNVLAGFDLGEWIFGMQGFNRGDGNLAFGVGLMSVTKAGKLAAGRAPEQHVDRQQEQPQAKPKPTPTAQPRKEPRAKPATEDRCDSHVDCDARQLCRDHQCFPERDLLSPLPERLPPLEVEP